MVNYLLDKGVNFLKQDNSGGTAAHHAIEKGHNEVIQAMID
jgi:ankyrin repeat protein